jgi:hypothetical protein
MAEAARYLGATEGELRGATPARRLLGLADQSRRFPHRGELRLEGDRLVLGGWLELPREQVERVSMEFTGAWTRFQAGGVRGRFPSLGFIGSLGKPLVLTRRGAEPIYLLVDYGRVSGATRNRRWLPRLRRWLEHGTP